MGVGRGDEDGDGRWDGEGDESGRRYRGGGMERERGLDIRRHDILHRLCRQTTVRSDHPILIIIDK